jgi:hypothetical protein
MNNSSARNYPSDLRNQDFCVWDCIPLYVITASLANKFEDLLQGLQWDRWYYNGLLKQISSLSLVI